MQIKTIITISLINLVYSFGVSQQYSYYPSATELNINHTYVLNNSGGGVSFFDFNADGNDDLTLATGKGELIQFYLNTGTGFNSIELNIENYEQVKSVLWVDFDNDGDYDFYATAFDGVNKLYKNTGDLIFEDITQSYGLPIESRRSFGAAWADINRDGWLDLYYTERPNSQGGETQQNRLFKNNKGKSFEEITLESNAGDYGRLPFCSAFLDYNNDKWPDIYIANDRDKGNTLLKNEGGKFTDVSDSTQSRLYMDAMNVAFSDIDNDGLQDLYITNTTKGNALLKSEKDKNGELIFSDKAEEKNVAFYGIGWGANFLDYNNDGWQDIYVSGMQIGSNSISSALYTNDGTGAFTKQIPASPTDTVTSFTNAIGDWNNDGSPDIMVNNSGGFSSELFTAKPSENNWVKINLKGVISNRDAIGTKVESYRGNNYNMQYTHCGIAFMGQNSKNLIFGCEQNSKIDSLIITWPTGHIDKLFNINTNQTIEITEGISTEGVINVDFGLDTGQLFVEEQTERGVDHDFIHSKFNGGGVAFVDLDNDGDDDIYLNGGSNPDRILTNDGYGFFTDITENTGIYDITDSIYTSGIIYGDIDNDGDQDLFVNTHYSDNISSWHKNLLFINNGDLTFTETWANDTDRSMTMGSVFIDYDLDGDLDIYNVNYVDQTKFTFDENNEINGFAHECFKNYMYKNNGDGTFTDVTNILELGDTGCALAVTATDFDSDGDLDIIVGNDFGTFIEPNRIFRNDYLTEGVFTEVGNLVNGDNAMFSMGIAIGDYDNDLDLDYYISNLGNNVLLENKNGVFAESAEESNVANGIVEKDSTLSISWGTIFSDFNNDMYQDLFIANGYVPAPNFVNNGNLEPDKLYLNNGDKTFTSLDSADGIWNERSTRGCAYSDINNDGLIDIYSLVYDRPTFGIEGGSCLFMNKMTNENNWVKIKLTGKTVNSNAYGSKIYVYTGPDTQMTEVSGGSSFSSHNSSIVQFGIADHESIDSISVIWTGGKLQQTIYNPEINTRHDIIESNTTSTKKLSNNNIKLGPNPSNGIINIKSEETISKISLLNIEGKIITEINNPNLTEYSLNIDQYPSSIYIIKVSTRNSTHTFKINKVRL